MSAGRAIDLSVRLGPLQLENPKALNARTRYASAPVT